MLVVLLVSPPAPPPPVAVNVAFVAPAGALEEPQPDTKPPFVEVHASPVKVAATVLVVDAAAGGADTTLATVTTASEALAANVSAPVTAHARRQADRVLFITFPPDQD
jgi:hypothetical protein